MGWLFCVRPAKKIGQIASAQKRGALRPFGGMLEEIITGFAVNVVHYVKRSAHVLQRLGQTIGERTFQGKRWGIRDSWVETAFPTELGRSARHLVVEDLL